MKTTELIEALQLLVDIHEKSGATAELGPHEIHMDVFQQTNYPDPNSRWQYRGVTGNLLITYTDDGVYCVLGPEEQWP